MTTEKNESIRQEILDAIAGGCSPKEIALLLDLKPANVDYYLQRLKKEGVIASASRGEYVVVDRDERPSPSASRTSALPEHASRKVAIPDYMRSRNAVTLYVEHSPTEVENVMRLELQIGGMWIPIPVSTDLRVCVGDDIPRWSATQEVYSGVTAMRVTLRNGEQNDFAHNPRVPITVDVK
jgi:Predicted transcriptional regulator